MEYGLWTIDLVNRIDRFKMLLKTLQGLLY